MVNLGGADDGSPAHRFLKSIHNIVIEKGWWQLTLRWGHSILEFYNHGIKDGTFDINNETHRCVAHLNPLPSLMCRIRMLATWLWSTFIKADLEVLRKKMNAKKMRKDRNKILPSGESSEYIYAFPDKVWCQCCYLIFWC